MKTPNTQAPRIQNVSLSLVVAAFNEEDVIEQSTSEIVDYLEKNIKSWQLILVSDGSTDRTGEIIDRLAASIPHTTALHLKSNSGMGAALKEGYAHVTQEWVTMLPADGQIKPTEINKLLVDHENYDVVTSLYDNRKYTIQRKVISLVLRFLTALIVGTRARTEGNYLVRQSVLKSFPLYSDSFLLNLEIPIRAKRKKLRLNTVYISVSPRIGGYSKALAGRRVWQTFYELFLLRLQMLQGN